MKVKILFIIMFVISYSKFEAQTTKSDPLFVDFKNNIGQKSIKNATYLELKNKNYKINYPKLNGQYQDFLQKNIKESINEYSCEESGFFQIEYKITHSSSNFISILKSIEIECSDAPGPDISEDAFNLIMYKNKLYKISLNSSTSIINLIKKKMDKECLENYELNSYFDFIVKDNRTYILNPLGGRECFTQIEFVPSEKLFRFSPAPARFPSRGR